MKCLFCEDTGVLGAKGIFAVYLKSWIVLVIFWGLSLLGALFFSPYLLILSAILFFIPLANADLRPYLYLYVLLSMYCSRRVNCPKCNPYGPIFLRNDPSRGE